MKIDGPDQASRLTHSLSMIDSGFSGVLSDRLRWQQWRRFGV